MKSLYEISVSSPNTGVTQSVNLLVDSGQENEQIDAYIRNNGCILNRVVCLAHRIIDVSSTSK